MENVVPEKVKLMVFFGSQVRGHARPDSDFDVLYVASAPLTAKEWADAAQVAGKLLDIQGANEDTIDLVDANEASPLLQFEAARSGRIIYGSRRDFINFILLAWKRYQHTAKFRRFRERALQEHGA
jgi:predicted nucleotidyltransferase